ncbi:mannosylglucosyl-3-phosphoglycerate phosphatase-like [Physella acuta]|uniref:mannosylglucosyl-3-phosphoglycerate phosphatase-like n=1 Tax=Physella acuta TaxID=109671 RepID=UPI0027DCE39A|nr:mannosylglucosyl-3-phosphoglycerate phosphatase-like [Physella acuta]XP_059158774.1 mannosylglucosyl-3-phosphoglycerate phosphatase-like [Physella acuta]XP_059158775.1 mannosylglucosyl-3-phosphoglycerate phosphatase-like [Physella acuta]XP_059158776.1 mannosylglucosyl-3-phosphoglycerate phosphatase-like [Physella acuta]
MALTILHFNDVYNIEGQKDEPRGGAARMHTYIKSQKKLDPLVLFSGDALNPSLMSIFLKGEQMIPILNELGVAAAVYGNHDFDFGVDHLKSFAEQCKFPWLLSNVKDMVNNEPLARGETYVMLEHAGIKIGIIGLVEEEWIDTLSTLDPDDVTFIDFVEAGVHLSDIVRQLGAQLVIALTHMRVPNDVRLAECVPGIDIILGGHDHDYEIINVKGKYVIKSGTDFRNMCKLTLTQSNNNSNSGWDVNVEKVDLDSSVPEDPEMLKVVQANLSSIDDKMDTYLGCMNVEMDGRFSSVRTQETNLGNFITDIILTATKADCALLNSGTFRSDRIHPKGDFKLRDLLTILPLVDALVVIKVTGLQLIEALENSVSKYPVKEGRFPQVAGLCFGFDPTRPAGQRIGKELVKVQDEYIDPDKEYRLATKEYVAQGKDGFDVLKDCEVLITSEQCPSLSTMVQNHFNAVRIFLGEMECPSGHRQSLVALKRREEMVKQMSVDIECSTKPRKLIRQESIHGLENEQNFLSPRVEGRIYILTEEKRRVMLSLMPSGMIRNLSTLSEESRSSSDELQ